MALPKKKISKSRKHKRRSHHALKLPNLISCPQCDTLIQPHCICSNCGHYQGRTYELPFLD